MAVAAATRCPLCPNATRQFASLEALYQHASAKHAEEFGGSSDTLPFPVKRHNRIMHLIGRFPALASIRYPAVAQAQPNSTVVHNQPAAAQLSAPASACQAAAAPSPTAAAAPWPLPTAAAPSTPAATAPSAAAATLPANGTANGLHATVQPAADASAAVPLPSSVLPPGAAATSRAGTLAQAEAAAAAAAAAAAPAAGATETSQVQLQQQGPIATGAETLAALRAALAAADTQPALGAAKAAAGTSSQAAAAAGLPVALQAADPSVSAVQLMFEQVPAAVAAGQPATLQVHQPTPSNQPSSFDTPSAGCPTTQLLSPQGPVDRCVGCGRQQQQQGQQDSLNQRAAGLASHTQGGHSQDAAGLPSPLLAGAVQASTTSAAAAAAALPSLGSGNRMAVAPTAGAMPPSAPQPANERASAPSPSLLRLTDTHNLGQLALPVEVLQQLYGYLAPGDLQDVRLVNKYLSRALLQQRVRAVGRLGTCVGALKKLLPTAAAAAAGDGGDRNGSSVGSRAGAAGTSAAAAAVGSYPAAAGAAAARQVTAGGLQDVAGWVGGLQVDVTVTQGSRQYELNHINSSRQQLACADSLVSQLVGAMGEQQQQLRQQQQQRQSAGQGSSQGQHGQQHGRGAGQPRQQQAAVKQQLLEWMAAVSGPGSRAAVAAAAAAAATYAPAPAVVPPAAAVAEKAVHVSLPKLHELLDYAMPRLLQGSCTAAARSGVPAPLAVVLSRGSGSSNQSGLAQLQLQAAQMSTNHATVCARITPGSAEEACAIWERLVNRGLASFLERVLPPSVTLSVVLACRQPGQAAPSQEVEMAALRLRGTADLA